MREGHTNRGHSGALYPQPAIVGTNSRLEGGVRTAAADSRVLRYGSCAIASREPCQVGNQAALSGFCNVPRGCLC